MAVQRDGEIVFAGGFGTADLENEVPATADTVYRIGSVTKQFTAAAALLLVEEGKLDLSADLHDYLSDYDTHGFEVSVERLLNHTSGIRAIRRCPSFGSGPAWTSVTRPCGNCSPRRPSSSNPGTATMYNNSGYYLLGVLIEQLSE